MTGRTAFLFLVRDRLNIPAVWRRFFAGREVDCAIYIHSKHPFVGEYLADRVLPDPAPTEWGWLLGAELRLWRRALEDPRVDWFVLLSESCLPLRGLDAVERALRRDGRSWIDVRPERNPERRPAGFPRENFYKQSQWAALTRGHVELIAADVEVAPQFLTSPISDEHYPVSLLSLRGRLSEVTRRPTTFTDWGTHLGAAHPRTFPRTLAWSDRRTLAAARAAGALFARKFPEGFDWSPLADWLEPDRPSAPAGSSDRPL